MTEQQLERFARHLSLSGVGMAGQERLNALRVKIDDHVPAAPVIRIALARSGAQSCETDAALVVAFGPTEDRVLFQPGRVEVGATSADSTWLGALVAAEILWWWLGHRAEKYELCLNFPEYRLSQSH